MDNEVEVILNLLEEILDKPKKSYHHNLQYGYNCPECDNGSRKGNLEVSLNRFVYHCWSCEISGPLGRLFDTYGTKKQKRLYLMVRPEEKKERKSNKAPKLELPEGFTLLKDANLRFPPHKEVLIYIKSRGITDEMIEKYQIGFTLSGKYSGRIIIPSYDKNNNLNYFVGRAWGKTRLKYLNPESEKENIIFNEHLIDWNEDIYLCEGMFDAMFLPNSIPMLGKHLSEHMFETIYNNAKKNIIICLDGDAHSAAVKLYHTLNGGDLYNRIKLVKLPKDKDVGDLRGEINDFYVEIK